MKYLIKNCHCYDKDYSCQSKDNITGKYCKDITNCIMKQIIRECKMNMSDDDFGYILKHKNDEGIIWLTDSSKAILNILRLLEIEEVE